MKVRYLAPLFVVFTLSIAYAADTDFESLAGLPPLTVNATVEAPLSVGIGEADLKSAVELRLRNAGIKTETGFLALLGPQLFVTVTAPSGDLRMYLIGITLYQRVKPFRPEGAVAPVLLMNTWKKQRFGMKDKNGNPIISTRELAEKIIDNFCQDFLRANPKLE